MSDKYADSNPPWRDYSQQLETPKDQAVICAWCRVVMVEGSLPASHGMCKPCVAKMDAALLTKYGGTGQ